MRHAKRGFFVRWLSGDTYNLSLSLALSVCVCVCVSRHVSSDDIHLVGGVRMSILYPIARLRSPPPFSGAFAFWLRTECVSVCVCVCGKNPSGMSWLHKKINNMSSGFCVPGPQPDDDGRAAAAATAAYFVLMMFAIHLFGQRICEHMCGAHVYIPSFI